MPSCQYLDNICPWWLQIDNELDSMAKKKKKRDSKHKKLAALSLPNLRSCISRHSLAAEYLKLNSGKDGNEELQCQGWIIISVMVRVMALHGSANEMNNSLGWKSGGRWWLVSFWGSIAGRTVVTVTVVPPSVLWDVLLELLSWHDPLYLLLRYLNHTRDYWTLMQPQFVSTQWIYIYGLLFTPLRRSKDTVAQWSKELDKDKQEVLVGVCVSGAHTNNNTYCRSVPSENTDENDFKRFYRLRKCSALCICDWGQCTFISINSAHKQKRATHSIFMRESYSFYKGFANKAICKWKPTLVSFAELNRKVSLS